MTSSDNKRSRILSILTISILMVSVAAVGFSGHVEAGENDVEFTILHTNDEHSALIPHSPAVDHDPGDAEDPTIGGSARLATAVREAREERDENVLLFNAGDFLGGSAFGWLAPEEGYAVELQLMQEMGYDAVIIGNHEYDYGTDVLADYLIDAGYPEKHEDTTVLASNTEAPAEHPLAQKDLYRDTALFELDGGITLGPFGLIGKDAVEVSAFTDDVEFPSQHETADRMVNKLEEKGADIVVAITHSGVDEDKELAREVPGIDIIVGGHCHTPLYEPIKESDTVIVQARSRLEYLGSLDLAYDTETGNLRVLNQENGRDFLTKIDGRFQPDPDISQSINGHKKGLNELVSEKTHGRYQDVMEVVARSDFTITRDPPMEETPMGNFVTDAMRSVTGNVTGERVDVAIQANGNIRGDIVPGSMPRGALTFSDIVETVGLGYGDDGYAGYPVVSLYLTGEEVRRVLEVAVLLEELMSNSYFLQFSGVRYEYAPDNAVLFTVPFMDLPIPTGRAVTEAELYTGEGIQDSEEYTELEKGDERLYHVVTDSHVLSFLPVIGDMVSSLEVRPKNREGERVHPDDFDLLTVHREDDTELKVWETVVEHAASQPEKDGIPSIPEYYADSSGRMNRTWSFPYVWLIYIILVIAALGTVVLIIRRRKKIDTSEDD